MTWAWLLCLSEAGSEVMEELKSSCRLLCFIFSGDDDEDGDEGIVGEHHVLVQLLPPRRFWNLPVERVCFRGQRRSEVRSLVSFSLFDL